MTPDRAPAMPALLLLAGLSFMTCLMAIMVWASAVSGSARATVLFLALMGVCIVGVGHSADRASHPTPDRRS